MQIELPPESGKLPANFIAGISADTAELAADLEGSSLQMQTSDCSAAAQVPDPEDMRSPSITCEPHYLNRLQSPETEDLIVGKGRTEALHPGDITTGMKTGDEHDFYGLPDAPSSTAADSDEGGWLDERFSFESEQAAVATSPEAVSDSRTSSPEAHDTLTAAQGIHPLFKDSLSN